MNSQAPSPESDLWCYLDPWTQPLLQPSALAPLVGVGDLCELTGSANAGKTYAAASIAAGVAFPSLASRILGGALLPQTTLAGGVNVTLIDAENYEGRWGSMMRRYLEAAGMLRSEYERRIIYAKPNVVPVGVIQPNEQKILEGVERLADLGTRLVIVDSAIPVFRPPDLNDARWAIDRLAPFRSACRSFGITSIVLSHTARGQGKQSQPNKPLGTTMQEGVADTVLHVRRLDKTTKPGIELVALKSRHAFWIPDGAHLKAFFTAGGHYECPDARAVWPLAPDDEGDPPDQLTPSQRQVLAALQSQPQGTATARALAASLGKEHDTSSRHLKALLNRGYVEKVDRGPNTRWRVTDEGRSQA